jgi:hypothetical protein
MKQFADGDSIIICLPCIFDLSGLDEEELSLVFKIAEILMPESRILRCERCQAFVDAYQASAEKAANDPTFHIVCQPCSQKVLAMPDSRNIFGGRVRDNVFPPKPDKKGEVN